MKEKKLVTDNLNDVNDLYELSDDFLAEVNGGQLEAENKSVNDYCQILLDMFYGGKISRDKFLRLRLNARGYLAYINRLIALGMYNETILFDQDVNWLDKIDSLEK
ncbi:MAG: hypothetical protein ACI4MQ_01995 [Candidatus Coproplasma sp.]